MCRRPANLQSRRAAIFWIALHPCQIRIHTVPEPLWTADGWNAVSVCIDSARSAGGMSRVSDFAGMKTTFIFDQFHALDCAAAAVRALAPDGGERKARMERIRTQLNGGRVEVVITGLKPHCGRDEAVAACVGCFETNRDRMRHDLCRKRRSAGWIRRRGKRLQADGREPLQAGANALLTAECCVANGRWTDFLDRRVGRAAAAWPKKVATPPLAGSAGQQ